MATILPNEVDELTGYVFHNYAWLMPIAEKQAYKAFMSESKADHSPKGLREHLMERMDFENPGMAKLL
ncbi:MAG: hypothetical protein EOP83_00670 [Verrucomicrobiaceae bacterium]|nr:MAG: hypothetical protein EOP83_00670 [Verrucomicrobiaceae bacterium]